MPRSGRRLASCARPASLASIPHHPGALSGGTDAGGAPSPFPRPSPFRLGPVVFRPRQRGPRRALPRSAGFGFEAPSCPRSSESRTPECAGQGTSASVRSLLIQRKLLQNQQFEVSPQRRSNVAFQGSWSGH